jgi:Transglutaminase-like superfamily
MKKYFLIPVYIVICATSQGRNLSLFPHSVEYGNADKYLVSGKLTLLDNRFKEEIQREIIINEKDVAGLGKIYSWIKNNFRNGKYNNNAPIKNVNTVFDSREMQSCQDWGLVFASISRYFGYPAVYVDTAGIEWAENFNGKSFSGHVFVEIFCKGKWILVDSTTGEYISEQYNPANPVVSIVKNKIERKGYYAIFKGFDRDDYGVKDRRFLLKRMEMFAKNFSAIRIEYSNYSVKRFE